MKNKDVIRNLNDEGLARFLTSITFPNAVIDGPVYRSIKDYLNEEAIISDENLKKYVDIDRLRNE